MRVDIGLGIESVHRICEVRSDKVVMSVSSWTGGLLCAIAKQVDSMSLLVKREHASTSVSQSTGNLSNFSHGISTTHLMYEQQSCALIFPSQPTPPRLESILK